MGVVRYVQFPAQLVAVRRISLNNQDLQVAKTETRKSTRPNFCPKGVAPPSSGGSLIGYDVEMEIRFRCDEEDIVRFHMRSEITQQLRKKAEKTVYLQSLVSICGGLLVFFQRTSMQMPPQFGFTLILAGIILPIFTPSSSVKTFAKNIRSTIATLGITFPDHGIARLTPDGLYSESARGNSTRNYASIDSVILYPDATYVMFSPYEGLTLVHNKISAGDIDAFRNELAQRNPTLPPRIGRSKFEV